MSGGTRIWTGSFVGSGAIKDIRTVGFRPKVVELLNTSGVCKATWTDSMPDGAMLKDVDTGSGTEDTSYVTANGVTPLADGFRIGTDTDLNVNGEVVHFIAHE